MSCPSNVSKQCVQALFSSNAFKQCVQAMCPSTTVIHILIETIMKTHADRFRRKRNHTSCRQHLTCWAEPHTKNLFRVMQWMVTLWPVKMKWSGHIVPAQKGCRYDVCLEQWLDDTHGHHSCVSKHRQQPAWSIQLWTQDCRWKACASYLGISPAIVTLL